MAGKKNQNTKKPPTETVRPLIDTNEIEALLIQIRDELRFITNDLKRQREL